MLYKTIVLNLLESHPKLHRELRLRRQLLTEVDRYANDLKAEYLELCQSLPPDAARETALASLEERISKEAARHEWAT
jgi:hypothetical protein